MGTTAVQGTWHTHLSQQGLQLDVFSTGGEEDLRLGRNLRGPRNPVLERIDAAKGNGVGIDALTRMRYGNLQRHAAVRSMGVVVVKERKKMDELGVVVVAVGIYMYNHM